ncbi:TonB-dependent receptor [Sphingomonas morindae]|uniref:TonB-dependent receptor n=1 Tax=Sphingomonas morindae TaxID=1541170 RepID=A0ABY4XD28_9SPHN|nr:TonB-dependent receptor [Sphingomonas morindae]USI74749.1 TonB-dependent receptor [Sphingomonas morindae]
MRRPAGALARTALMVGVSGLAVIGAGARAQAPASDAAIQAAPPTTTNVAPVDGGAATDSTSAQASSAPKAPETNPVAGTHNDNEVNGAGNVTNGTGSQEIIVTGLRGSLQRNMDIKRASPGIVDAISAEDIGKFPDSNVAAALQRVPGVSVSRGTSSLGGLPGTTGDAVAITVRGFGPAFNETLYDGRPISSGTSSRGFDFSTVGADFVGELDILKTPDAGLAAGAIGATINIKFPKPFDHPGFRLAASASGSINDGAGKAAPAGGLLLSDTFADDTIGVLADVIYTQHKTQTNHINNQGWNGAFFAPCQQTATCTDAQLTDANKTIPGFYSQDYGIYREDTKDTRIDGRIALQWKPSEAVLLTIDDNFSRQKIRADQSGYSVWFNQSNLRDITFDKNGTVTSFTQPASPTDFQGQINQQVLQNNQLGGNLKWDVSDRVSLNFDGSHARSWLNPGGQFSSLDVDVGYGGPNATSVGLTNIGTNSIPAPTGYGPAGDSANFLGNGIIGSHVVPITSQRNKDTVDQAKFEAAYNGDDLKIRIGAQYVRDQFQLSNYDTFTNNFWQAYSGYGPASGSATGLALPQNLFTNSFSTANFIPGFSGAGALPPRVLVFDPYAVLNYIKGLGNPQTQNIPGYNYGSVNGFTGTYDSVLNPASFQKITERVWSGYLTLHQETKIGDMPFHINAGLREEVTKVTSEGLGQLPTGLTVQTGDLTAFLVSFTGTTPVSTTHTYSYLLPNLDLGLNVTDKLKLRFDASRTLTRPALNVLTPVLNVPNTQRVGALVATGGNPRLNPYLADNFDVGAEWYYRRNSYASVDFFVKRVTNFVVGGSTRQAINGVVDPTTGAAASFTVTQQVNGPSAVIKGVELAVQHVFADTGFGFTANATFVGTNKKYDPSDISISGFAVTGLANSANFVGFYDKHGFQARVAVNWRDEYLDRFGQTQNNSAFGTEPTFVNASTQVDFSTSYDINKQISVFFEALNLNDETLSTHGRYSNQLLDAFRYGRRFTVGAHFRL